MRREFVILAALAAALGGWWFFTGDTLAGGFAALLAVCAVVVLARAAGAKDATSPIGQPAAPQQAMTLHNGRWLRWDGSRWVDAETGAPVV